MPSPIVGDDLDVQNFSGDVCERFRQMLELHNKMKEWFDWAFNDDGTFSADYLAGITSAVLPLGAIIWRPDDDVPVGFVKADGRAISRTTYADLFALWGTERYGPGDGSTTFNVIDMQGKVPMGANATYPVDTEGGEAAHALVSAEIGGLDTHVHVNGRFQLVDNVYLAIGTQTDPDLTGKKVAGNEDTNVSGALSGLPANSSYLNTGGPKPAVKPTGHNNLQPYHAGIWIIRAL